MKNGIEYTEFEKLQIEVSKLPGCKIFWSLPDYFSFRHEDQNGHITEYEIRECRSKYREYPYIIMYTCGANPGQFRSANFSDVNFIRDHILTHHENKKV